MFVYICTQQVSKFYKATWCDLFVASKDKTTASDNKRGGFEHFNSTVFRDQVGYEMYQLAAL